MNTETQTTENLEEEVDNKTNSEANIAENDETDATKETVPTSSASFPQIRGRLGWLG